MGSFENEITYSNSSDDMILELTDEAGKNPILDIIYPIGNINLIMEIGAEMSGRIDDISSDIMITKITKGTRVSASIG